MLRSMTADQFIEWQAYADLEPFDELRADFRTATIVQFFANLYRDPDKRRTPFTLDDCRLKVGDDTRAAARQVERQQTPEEIERIITTWIRASNTALKEQPHAAERRRRTRLPRTERPVERHERKRAKEHQRFREGKSGIVFVDRQGDRTGRGGRDSGRRSAGLSRRTRRRCRRR